MLRERETSLLKEMTKIANAAEGLPDAEGRRSSSTGSALQPMPRQATLERPARPDLHRVHRHQALPRAAAPGGYREHRPGRRPDRLLPRRHGRRPPRGDQARASTPTRPKHPLRILIATDAAREGVNLQNHCADLFHFDVPWNPSRMEQRNGRIDRKLQRAPRSAATTSSTPSVPRTACSRRSSEDRDHREELGSLSPVLERRLEKLLSAGIRRKRVDELAQRVDRSRAWRPSRQATVEEELEAARERGRPAGQADRDRCAACSVSKTPSASTKDAFRDALSCALDPRRKGPREARPNRAPSSAVLFPALDERGGADPTWAATLDTLRAPRPKGQKPWMAPDDADPPGRLRDPGTLDDESSTFTSSTASSSASSAASSPRASSTTTCRGPAWAEPRPDPSRPVARPALALRRWRCAPPRRDPDGGRPGRGWLPKVKVLTVAEQDESMRLLADALRDSSSPEPSLAISQQLRKVAANHLAELLPQLERRGGALGSEPRRSWPSEPTARPRTWSR